MMYHTDDDSFDASFDVSHIEHESSLSEEESNEPKIQLTEHSSIHTRQQLVTHTNTERNDLSYDEFIGRQNDTGHTLQSERTALRQRRSGQLTSPPDELSIDWRPSEDSLLRAAIDVHGKGDWESVAAAFKGARSKRQCKQRWSQLLNPSPVSSLPSQPFIPKLTLGSLVKSQHQDSSVSVNDDTIGATSTVGGTSSSSRPTTTSMTSGSITTRSRLTLFNLKLRSARKIQLWYRTLIACQPARAEARLRRSQLDDLHYRSRGFAPGLGSDRPLGKPLQFEDEDQDDPVQTSRQKGLKSLHQKMKEKRERGESNSPTRQQQIQSHYHQLSNPTTQGPTSSPPRARARAHSAHPASSRSPTRYTSSVGGIFSSPFASPQQRRAATANTTAVTNRTNFHPFPSHAIPSLRALLQGFLIRHQFQYSKPILSLVQQIRDIDRMIEQVDREKEEARKRNDSVTHQEIQYGNYFVKTLRQQSGGLKQSLFTILHTTPSNTKMNSAKEPDGVISPSSCRIHFTHKSHRTEYGEVLASDSTSDIGVDSSTTRTTERLRRKSQRRFLKKSTAVMSNQPNQPASARPSTAAAAPLSHPWSTEPVEEEKDSSHVDSSAVDASSASGASTARAFLKRKSQKQSAQKLDWSRVGSRVDAKLDGYKQPSGIIWDSATGKEYDSAIVQRSSVGGVLSPTQASLLRDRMAAIERARKSALGSQTARDSVSRKVFRPSGHPTVLPLQPNTDSAAPPLSPQSTNRTGRKSRHIILEARKLDLSKVTSRVDYRSPYKTGADSLDGDAYEDEDQFNNREPMHSVSSSPPRSSNASKRSRPRAQSARTSFSPIRRPTRTGVTVTREELMRLDQELEREQQEQHEQEEAWSKHGEPQTLQEPNDASYGVGRPTIPSVPMRERASSDPEVNLSSTSFDDGDWESPNRDVQSHSAHVSPVESPSRRDPPSSSSQPSTAAVRPTGAHHPTRLSQQELLINAEIEDIERSLSEMSNFTSARGQARRDRPTTSATTTNSSRFSMDHLPEEWKRTVPADAAGPTSSLSPIRKQQTRTQTTSHDPQTGVLRLTLQFDDLAAQVNSFLDSAR